MKTLPLLFAVLSLLSGAASHAALVNFEYTVSDISADAPLYRYDFQFWVDVDDPAYTPSLGFNSIDVNISEGQGPRPFGENFITMTMPGFTASDVTGLPNSVAIRPDGPGFAFWQPTADDFVVAFTGISSVLGDMTWNYFGRTDVDISTSLFSGIDRPGLFLTTPAVNSLTNFEAPVDPPTNVLEPSTIALLLAAFGACLATRRRRMIGQLAIIGTGAVEARNLKAAFATNAQVFGNL